MQGLGQELGLHCRILRIFGEWKLFSGFEKQLPHAPLLSHFEFRIYIWVKIVT